MKDASFEGEYEKRTSLEFIIDDIGNENVVIEDIILDKKDTVVIGEVCSM